MRPSYVKLVENVKLPKMALVRQHFAAQDVEEPAHAVHDALAAAGFVRERIRPGMSVALYARGGLAALEALDRAAWDVFSGRPAPTRWTFAKLAVRELIRR